MKLAHFIKVSVFSDKGDEKVERCLHDLFPFEIGKYLTKKIAIGFNEREIQTYEVNIDNNSLINKFLDHLKGILNDGQRKLLIRQKEHRLDNDLYFFIRLDKPRLIEGKVFVTDSGDCFHIRISIASFPKKREIGLKMVEEIFG